MYDSISDKIINGAFVVLMVCMVILVVAFVVALGLDIAGVIHIFDNPANPGTPSPGTRMCYEPVTHLVGKIVETTNEWVNC